MESSTTSKNTHNFTYTYFSTIEALKSYKMSDSMISDYMDRMSEREPMSYYINYVRYLRSVVVTFPKKSIFWKLVLSLAKWESKRWFISCNIKDLWDKIKVQMSFLDLVKVQLMWELMWRYWLNVSLLKLVFLALRFDMNQKEKGVIEYIENTNFEKLLFYALKYRKSSYLSISVGTLLNPITYFINGSDIWNLRSGIVINILNLLEDSEVLKIEKNSSKDILEEELTSHIQWEKRKKKEEYIKKLYEKTSIKGAKTGEEMWQSSKNLWRMAAELDKAEIELLFWFYDIDEWDNQWEYPDRVQDIEKFLEQNASWEYKLEIKEGEVRYAKNDFSTSDLSNEKYVELKEYVSWYWYVAPDEYNGRVTRIVWRTTRKYWKKGADD